MEIIETEARLEGFSAVSGRHYDAGDKTAEAGRLVARLYESKRLARLAEEESTCDGFTLFCARNPEASWTEKAAWLREHGVTRAADVTRSVRFMIEAARVFAHEAFPVDHTTPKNIVAEHYRVQVTHLTACTAAVERRGAAEVAAAERNTKAHPREIAARIAASRERARKDAMDLSRRLLVVRHRAA